MMQRPTRQQIIKIKADLIEKLIFYNGFYYIDILVLYTLSNISETRVELNQISIRVSLIIRGLLKNKPYIEIDTMYYFRLHSMKTFLENKWYYDIQEYLRDPHNEQYQYSIIN